MGAGKRFVLVIFFDVVVKTEAIILVIFFKVGDLCSLERKKKCLKLAPLYSLN
jgi:hypothetical protein